MLFSLEETNQPQKTDPVYVDASAFGNWQAAFVQGNSLEAMRAHFEHLHLGDSCEFATGGRWSFHEMILYFLGRLGRCEVALTTWAISENPVRALVMAKEAGLISRLDVLLDLRIRNNQGEALALLLKQADSHRLTKIHAKVCALVGEKSGASILTSANLTVNKRIEAGTVRLSRESALLHQSWIKKEIEHGTLIGKSGTTWEND